MDEFQREVRRVFWQASEIPGDGRAGYLDEVCAGDPKLRAEVESLLAAEASGREFLESPALEGLRDWFDQHPATERPDEETDKTPERIGAYRVLRTLGRGGMGVVYLAEEEGPISRQVALKVIKLGMDTEKVIARFESELAALARMSHSHIARVYASGATPEGRPFFAMEYVPGEAITDYCDANRLGIEERLRIFVDVCDAVQHAHSRGTIHRDIKPSNVLVTREGERSVAKVIDFGIAKALDVRRTTGDHLTEHGRIIGTPEYMSPEQAGGDPLDVDTRTDVYSLGVLLYELLAGARPFDTGSVRGVAASEVQRVLREEGPARPSSRLRLLDGEIVERVAEVRGTHAEGLRRALRVDLDWIVMKANEKEREQRYATASELAADIGRHARNEPVLASPPSLMYRSRKLLRKHHGPVAAAGVVLVALVAGLAVSTTMYFRADRAEKDTRHALDAARDALGRSEARRFTAYSAGVLPSNPDLALLLALEGVSRHEEKLSLTAVSSALAVLVPSRTLLGHANPMVNSTAFDPRGERVVTAGRDGTARVWDAKTGALLSILAHSRTFVIEAVFSPDGSRILTATGREACVWDATGRARLIHRLQHEGIISVTFSPDGERVLTSGANGVLQLWDPTSGQRTGVIETDGSLRSARFTPDGRRILTASNDRRTWLWDAESGARLATFGGRGAFVARLSPDGHRVFTSSLTNGEASLWDIAEISTPKRLALRGHETATDSSPPRRTRRRASGMCARVARSVC